MVELGEFLYIKEDQESLVENVALNLIGLLSATAEKIQFISIDQI
jgi:hypothetical protein